MELSSLEIASQAIIVALKLAAPILGLSLLVGFTISIIQAVTSIQEQTLTFVPKIFMTGIALMIFGPFMLGQMQSFATAIFGHLENFVH